MGMQVEGQVGPRTVADGSNTELRQTRQGGLVVADGHGRYTEATSRGFTAWASTGAAGVAPGTALSTTPPMAIWNPPGSGVNICILISTVSYVSGTLGAGSLVYGAVLSQPAAPTGGTELLPIPGLISGAKPKGRAFQGSTLAATPTILAPAFSLTAALATTAVQPFVPAKDEVAGSIIVPPGTVLIMQGIAAAGTTPLVIIGINWEEMPL
jgi:hypothetical protein